MSSGPNAARLLDPVAEALAGAPGDERQVTEEEREALRAARADGRPLVPGAMVTAGIVQRSRDEE